MTQVQEAAPEQLGGPAPRALRLLVAVLSAVLLAVVLVVLTPLLGHPTVSDRAEQADVAFGAPIPWVHQDQGALDPPFPSGTRILSPWEHPVSLSEDALLVDVLIALAAVALLFGLAAGAVRLLSTPRRP